MKHFADQAVDRMRRPDFDRWMEQAASAGYCANPVRLVGSTETFDSLSGEMLRSYSSRSEPDGITFVRCGNRRATRCPSCSHEYKGDMWHLVVAGATGGSKGVPDSVGTHPLAFATLTAPSFGAVHTAGKDSHTRCHPRESAVVCAHGRRRSCGANHAPGDPLLGEPLCADCYDYRGQIVWQWHAPELWRRFTIRLRRALAQHVGLSEAEARKLVRVQFAKVAEFQRRGAVHFHALIRLDGDPTAQSAFPKPGIDVSPAVLCELIRAAAESVEIVADPLPDEAVARVLRWGRQCDARAVIRGDGTDGTQLTDRAVAAYIAKYATKATEDLDPGTGSEGRRPHLARIRGLVERLGHLALHDDGSPYRLLSRWESMLGFRGHFSTKSRRYSVTLGRLRSARRRWVRQSRNPSDPPAVTEDWSDEADDESTLVIATWAFAGMGWLNAGDAALASESAAAAREWRDARAQKRRSQHTNEG